jgi:hypothetical protein
MIAPAASPPKTPPITAPSFPARTLVGTVLAAKAVVTTRDRTAEVFIIVAVSLKGGHSRLT